MTYDPFKAQASLESLLDSYPPVPSPYSGEEDAEAAEAFFNAAQRRLGTLPNRLIGVQCRYLAGLYAKFVLRPLTAWTLLQGACVQLQALLFAKGLQSNKSKQRPQARRARHLEQRLYWSCVKAE